MPPIRERCDPVCESDVETRRHSPYQFSSLAPFFVPGWVFDSELSELLLASHRKPLLFG